MGKAESEPFLPEAFKGLQRNILQDRIVRPARGKILANAEITAPDTPQVFHYLPDFIIRLSHAQHDAGFCRDATGAGMAMLQDSQ